GADKMIAPPPIPLRVADGDVVIVGKVTDIEDKTVKAPRYPGDKEMGEYQIAVVKINEALIGAKGVTHLKVAFLPPVPGPRGRYTGNTNLTKGQQVCLILKGNPQAPSYRIRTFMDI